MKKLLKVIIAAVIIIFLSGLVYLLNSNYYKDSGSLKVSSLKSEVKVIRDEKGMAYIYADNLTDAIRAQGFVTAQDRLFQLELHRLFSQGRITELAGEDAIGLDTRMRTIGFHRHAKEHEKILSQQSREFIEAYADGINDFIKFHADDLPLEFTLAGIEAGLWDAADVLSVIYYLGWGSAANLETELVSQMIIEKTGFEKAKEIFPVNINPDESGSYQTRFIDPPARQQTGKNLLRDKKLMAFVNDTIKAPWLLKTGSNNWAMSASRSKNGKPVVVDDPHLETSMIPAPMYPVSIVLPDNRLVGTTVPGVPGFLVGRSKYIGFGVTNAYGDAQDLYIETINPQNSKNYLEGNRSIPFKIIKETLKIKDDSAENGKFRDHEIEIKETKRGPVISDVIPGFKTQEVITLRWSVFETKQPDIGINEIFTARNVSEARKALRKTTFAMLNYIFADIEGNIAYQATGRLPVRSQGESIFPHRVNSSTDNWVSYIPVQLNPNSENPDKGWLGTANHKTITKSYPFYYSSYFAPSYRYSRMKELFESKKSHSVEDHFNYQRDIKNKFAEQIVPVFVEALQKNEDMKQVVEIFKQWDFQDSKDKAAPLIFQDIFMKSARETYQDELGKELFEYMFDVVYYWQESYHKMLISGKGWFDDITTTDKIETRNDIIIRAATKSINELTEKYGSNLKNLKWGDVHQIKFVSPIMRSGILSGVFGGGTHRMSGSPETLYRASYKPTEPYSVIYSAALRMVADLGDPDKVIAVIPGGVTGRIFNANTTDQIDAYMQGTKVYWWFSDKLLDENKSAEYILSPDL